MVKYVLKFLKVGFAVYVTIYLGLTFFGRYRSERDRNSTEYRVWTPIGFERGYGGMAILLFFPLVAIDAYVVHTTEITYHNKGDGGCTEYHRSVEPCLNHPICKPPYWEWDKDTRDWKPESV